MTKQDQRQITQAGALLNEQGDLTQVGWMPYPLLDCNLEDAHFYKLRALQQLRIKRWDYYALFTPTHFFSFTISDIGYMGMVFAYVVDFANKYYHEESVSTLFGSGVSLPRNSSEGESNFDNGKVRIDFHALPEKRTISADWGGFDGKGLSAEIYLRQPKAHESMTIVIPIPDKRFYYNRKINCMPAEGWVKYGDERYELNPATCLGSLDWGRGVWAYDSFWVWASASGFLANGQTIGLNMGYGFGDSSAATENAFILDGKVHKLGLVDFGYDPNNFRQPWAMKSPDGRLELTFSPFFERVAKTDFKLLRSEVHQMFGRYNGRLVTDHGEVIEIHDLTGFAEEHHAKW